MAGLSTPNGPELLRAWIERAKHATQYEAAVALGYSEGVISQWLARTRKPSIEVAIDLYEKTGVPVQSWALRRLSKTKNGGRRTRRKSKTLQRVKTDAD